MMNLFKAKEIASAIMQGPRHSARRQPIRKVYGADHIGIIGFHDKGFIIAKPAEAHSSWLQERSQHLHNKIAGSSTNLTDGLRKAIALVKASPSGGLRRVWLLSDGHPNVETVSIWVAVDEARHAFVNVNTIAFGDDADEGLLRRISAATHNGKFVAVHTLRQLTNALVSGSNDHSNPKRHHHRAETTVLAVDCSGSMLENMDGKRKIDIVEEAMLHLLHYKQQCFS